MTEAQRKHFYFPKWLALARRFDWRMEGGRLVADPVEQSEQAAMFSLIACRLIREIITHARELAGREQRAVTADDLRHGCNLVASRGRTASAGKLTNAELNEFDRLCRLLANPFEDNLGGALQFLNPAEDDRQRAIRYLRSLSYDAQLAAISENTWGTRDWEALDPAQLGTLARMVKQSGRRKFAKGPF